VKVVDIVGKPVDAVPPLRLGGLGTELFRIGVHGVAAVMSSSREKYAVPGVPPLAAGIGGLKFTVPVVRSPLMLLKLEFGPS
jgi:hypothetical protein